MGHRRKNEHRTEQNRTEQNRTEQNRTEGRGPSVGELETPLPSGSERQGKPNWRRRCLTGVAGHADFSGKSMFNKQKWLPIAEYLPVPISMYCCNITKKQPMQKYSRSTKSYPIIGTMAEESRMRKQAWIRQGCNAFTGKIHSQPMSFWTEQDVLEYIKTFNVEICSVYGDINIVNKKGNIIETEEAGMPEGCKWQCSGCQRTGCWACAYGAHSEKGETRFQRLAKTHPRQYEYCINGGQWVDNPTYDPTIGNKPDELGWIPWNPAKIFVPSKQGLGLGTVFKMCNELIPGMYRWE